MTPHSQISRNGPRCDVIDSASHAPFPEQPDAVTSAVIRHLQTLT